MSRGRRMWRVLLLVSVSFVGPSVISAQDPAGADKTGLRAALGLAYARTYSVAELLIGATKAYSIACNDPKSYTTLMMIDMMLTRALDVKKSIADNLATAVAVAIPDAAAHESATSLVEELSVLPDAVATIMEPAKRCETFMRETDSAADKASSDGDDMTWDAARQHSSINILRLAKFDVEAELRSARLIVERTK